MGRLGSQTLAAGALGTNLYFMVFIFGLGLMLATSPMMATELGRRRHSVRDIRRTVRQGLWQAVLVAFPIWLFLWHCEAVLLALGRLHHNKAHDVLLHAMTELPGVYLWIAGEGPDRAALTTLAEELGVAVSFFTAARLEEETPRIKNPSAIVFARVGCHGVAESAALAAAGAEAELVVPKIKSAHATAAVARMLLQKA